jgi:hypothetical protein
MSPYDSTRLSMGVISVYADINNAANTRVAWSYSHNGASVPGQCQQYTMPTGLLAAGSSAIIVEGRFDYEPLIVSHYLNSSITLQDKATLSPRSGNCVLWDNGGGASTTCMPTACP